MKIPVYISLICILPGCAKYSPNKEVDVFALDAFIDSTFAPDTSWRTTWIYRPTIEDGKLRNFMLDLEGDSLFIKNERFRSLLEKLVEVMKHPNPLDSTLLQKSKHILLEGDHEPDSLFTIYGDNFLGEISVSSICLNSDCLAYCEAVDPLHYRGVGRFLYIVKEENQWIVADEFNEWSMSSEEIENEP